jgi:hypothetical protein
VGNIRFKRHVFCSLARRPEVFPRTPAADGPPPRPPAGLPPQARPGAPISKTVKMAYKSGVSSLISETIS